MGLGEEKGERGKGERIGARTVYPVQTGGFHQAPSGPGKIVPEHGTRRDRGEHLARLDPADGEDHSQVRVLLLEVHQRAKPPRHAITGRPGIGVFVA